MSFSQDEYREESLKQLSVWMAGYLENVKIRIQVYPHLINKLPEYAKQGWFVSSYFGFSELDDLALQAGQLSADQTDQFLAGMYRSSLREHAANIIRDNPKRAFVVEPAVAAHERGEYALSVLAFFAQADGVLSQQAGKELFQGNENERLSAFAREQLNGESHWFQHPIPEMGTLMAELTWASHRERSPISYSKNAREDHNYSGLNRHTVLHGEALEEYATEINSLRAFSLLSSVSALTADLQEPM